MNSRPKVNKEDIEKLAKLARIELKEGEKDKFTKDISSILGYVAKLSKVKVKDGLDFESVEDSRLREDKVVGISKEEQENLISLGPAKEKNLIKAKAVFE